MTTTDLLAEYDNGNCHVRLFDDGSKTRTCEGVPEPEYPESIDLKITDYCDGKCPFCHESSTKGGSDSCPDYIETILSGLPKGVEIAIGGGNPLSHPDLMGILYSMKKNGLIANLTVHANHWMKEWRNLWGYLDTGLIHGLGISYGDGLCLCTDFVFDSRCVLHVIAGVNRPEEILHHDFKNVLILGYKRFGRGKNHIPDNYESNLRRLRYFLPGIMQSRNVSFDNLALEQLRVKEMVTSDVWEKHYMGDDGQFTMYIDAVKREYAASSTSVRKMIGMKTIREMFQDVRDQ